MSVDLVHPAVDKVTLVLEGVGDGKVRVNSASLDHPFESCRKWCLAIQIEIRPKNEAATTELKKRTLTNLYNERPQWLADAHRDLDIAVAVAYGWPAAISEQDALANLLELNWARRGMGSSSTQKTNKITTS